MKLVEIAEYGEEIEAEFAKAALHQQRGLWSGPKLEVLIVATTVVACSVVIFISAT